MRRDISEDHPLRSFFENAVHESLSGRLGLRDCDDVEKYLAQLLVLFLHHENIFSLRDAGGRRLESISEMLAEGDVRLNAVTFDREREVHRHIGDFLMFWSGVFPEFLSRVPELESVDDAVNRGRFSYYVVGSFDHAPYDAEAPTFRKLSAEFEACREGLLLVRAAFEGFQGPGWGGGFRA